MDTNYKENLSEIFIIDFGTILESNIQWKRGYRLSPTFCLADMVETVQKSGTCTALWSRNPQIVPNDRTVAVGRLLLK